MKYDDCRFCGGEERTRRSRHLVESALVPGHHLNVLEIVILQDVLNEAKLERVAPAQRRPEFGRVSDKQILEEDC